MKQRNKYVFLDNLFENSEIRVAVSQLHGSVCELFPPEMNYVQGCIPQRIREYTAGRLIARDLLSYHNIYNFPLLSDNDRVPIWPSDILGTIAHCKEYCVVAITGISKQENLFGIGVDVEPEQSIEPELWPFILREDELKTIENIPLGDRGSLVRKIFCAKEAVYKSVFPKVRKIIEFQDVKIDFLPGNVNFEASFFDETIQNALTINKSYGTIHIYQGHIFSGARTYM